MPNISVNDFVRARAERKKLFARKSESDTLTSRLSGAVKQSAIFIDESTNFYNFFSETVKNEQYNVSDFSFLLAIWRLFYNENSANDSLVRFRLISKLISKLIMERMLGNHRTSSFPCNGASHEQLFLLCQMSQISHRRIGYHLSQNCARVRRQPNRRIEQRA